jgi:hypothetical protein
MKAARWTKKQLEEFQQKVKDSLPGYTFLMPKNNNEYSPYKNKSEQEYASILENKKRNGDIFSWKYEPYSIKIAKRTHIIPDFIVTTAAGQEVHEVKGFERPAWKAKWKIFKEMYSKEFYRFLVCKKINGTWRIE